MKYLDFYSLHLRNPRIRGSELHGHCPFHDDREPSFSASIETGLFNCHAQCGGGNARQFAERLGVEPPDENERDTKREIIASYEYKDENGQPLYRICRTIPKSFFGQRYEGGQWVNGLKDVRRVLYRLPDILKAPDVYIVEGEKDVDCLWSMGKPATCNPGGAGKWKEEYSKALGGKKAVIIPDNDKPGEIHALQVVKSLLPFAEAVEVVSLPGLGPRKEKHGEDISDWLDAGHSKEELTEAVTRIPLVDPENSFPHYREKSVRKEKIRLESWGEFLDRTPEEREYTVDGVLPDMGLVVLSGRGFSGKSSLAVNLCRMVASGLPFLMRKTKQKIVVYLNFEMPPDYAKILLEGGEIPEGAYFLDHPEPVLRLETVQAVINEAGSQSGLLVIDSFRGAFKLTGDAENSAGGAGVILRKLQDIAIKTHWLILVIHHRNRSQREGTDSISGTSDWIAAPDVVWTWSRSDPEKPGTLIVEGRIPPLEPMAVRLSPSECVYVGGVKETRGQTEIETLLSALDGNDKQTVEELEQTTKIPPATVRKRLESVEGRLVEKSGEGVKGDAYRWSKIHSAQDNSPSADRNSNDAMGMAEKEFVAPKEEETVPQEENWEEVPNGPS